MFNFIKKRLIHRALSKALLKAKKQPEICVDKIVVFSDHHKGIRDASDDFRSSEPAYLKALDYYEQHGYTLILLGDSEEFWEVPLEKVIEVNSPILKKEALFFKKGLYYRVFGNHDDVWASKRKVKKYLSKDYPGLITYESIIITVGNKHFFLVHGHQGELLSDHLRYISKLIVKWFWRPYQIITKKKLSRLSGNLKDIQWHDTAIYSWAVKHKNLVTIAGHTHRPIWLSLSHEEQQKQTIPKRKPCYFNTGCCSFSDGDITGIEITAGGMQLIKFSSQSLTPIVLAEQND